MSDRPELRSANAEERKHIYGFMKRQFPPDELKPLRAVEELLRRGIYEVYGLWDGGRLIAYALLGCDPEHEFWLLDYYGVTPENQSAGWGSRFLRMLRERFPERTVLIEVEDPAAVSADPETAKRRIRFYERNGCRMTGVAVRLFGVEYLIMFLSDGDCPDERARRGMEAVYRGFLPKLVYRRFVRFREEKR